MRNLELYSASLKSRAGFRDSEREQRLTVFKESSRVRLASLYFLAINARCSGFFHAFPGGTPRPINLRPVAASYTPQVV